MDVIMPQLGDTVVEGVVTRWYKKAGEAVEADEVLADVETEKVSTEVPAPASGIVEKILVDEGATVKVGACLAVIRESSAAATKSASGPIAPSISDDGVGAQRISPTAAHADEIAKPPRVPPRAGAQDRLSPTVRDEIAENDGDSEARRGTADDGRIMGDDVNADIDSGSQGTGGDRKGRRR